ITLSSRSNRCTPTSKLLLIFISLTFTYTDSLSGCMMTHSGTGKYFFKYCMIFLFGNFKLPTEMDFRSEEHTSELQSRFELVCRILLEKKKYLSISFNYLSSI